MKFRPKISVKSLRKTATSRKHVEKTILLAKKKIFAEISEFEFETMQLFDTLVDLENAEK